MRRSNSGLANPSSSGGSISVTDGTTTVNPATVVRFSTGVVTASGSEALVSLTPISMSNDIFEVHTSGDEVSVAVAATGEVQIGPVLGAVDYVLELYAGSVGVTPLKIYDHTSYPIFTINEDGTILVQPSADLPSIVVFCGGNGSSAQPVIQILGGDNNPAFEVRANGSVHIRTGTSILADL